MGRGRTARRAHGPACPRAGWDSGPDSGGQGGRMLESSYGDTGNGRSGAPWCWGRFSSARLRGGPVPTQRNAQTPPVSVGSDRRTRPGAHWAGGAGPLVPEHPWAPSRDPPRRGLPFWSARRGWLCAPSTPRETGRRGLRVGRGGRASPVPLPKGSSPIAPPREAVAHWPPTHQEGSPWPGREGSDARRVDVARGRRSPPVGWPRLTSVKNVVLCREVPESRTRNPALQCR